MRIKKESDKQLLVIDQVLNCEFERQLKRISSKFVTNEVMSTRQNEREVFIREMNGKMQKYRAERRKKKQLDMKSELMLELDLNGTVDESKLEIKPKSALYDQMTGQQLQTIRDREMMDIHEQCRESRYNTKYYKRMRERKQKGEYDSTMFYDQQKWQELVIKQIDQNDKYQLEDRAQVGYDAFIAVIQQERVLIEQIHRLQKVYDGPLDIEMQQIEQIEQIDIGVLQQTLAQVLAKEQDGKMETIEKLLRILVSYSMRDVSIIIKISKEQRREYERIEVDGQQLFYRIGVVDVELKPVSKLKVFLEDDQRLFEIYLEILEQLGQ